MHTHFSTFCSSHHTLINYLPAVVQLVNHFCLSCTTPYILYDIPAAPPRSIFYTDVNNNVACLFYSIIMAILSAVLVYVRGDLKLYFNVMIPF
jgi:hypothetical protein